MSSYRTTRNRRGQGAVRRNTRRTRMGSTGSFISLPNIDILGWFERLNRARFTRARVAPPRAGVPPITRLPTLPLGNYWRRISNWAWSSTISGLVLLGLIFLVNYLLTTPELMVRTVKVTGTVLLQPAQVERTSGTLGSNIFMINTQHVVSNLLAEKAVHSASVQLRLPNEVLINVEERPAQYVWKVGDTMYAVSSDGYVIGVRNKVEGVIGIVDVDAAAVKQNDAIDPKVLAAARAYWDALPKRTKITPAYFEYSHTQGLILPNARGGRIILGDDTNLDAKLANLNGILAKLEQDNKQAKMIDLRNIERPYMTW